MNKFLKYGLLGVGGVLLVAAGGAAYIAATFNPNDYKAQLIRLVKEKKQRTLRLDSDIRLTFFPNLGADLGKVSLSEPNSDKTFAELDGAHVSLALWPLLARRVVVDEVRIDGLKVELIKTRDGHSNIDDLLGKNESAPAAGNAAPAGGGSANSPMTLGIAAIRVEKSELDYFDEASGAHYALKDIALKTGRIAEGQPTPVDFSATLQSIQPKLDVAAQLKTSLTFNLDKFAYRLQGLELQTKGTLAGGDVAVMVSAQDFSGDVQSFHSDALALELDAKQPQQEFKLKFSSPVSGDLKAGRYSLPALAVAVTATGDALPQKSVSSEMKGSAELDTAHQSATVNLAGGLLQSQVKARLALNGFSEPAIRFDADVDRFDADVYLPKKTGAAPQQPQSAAGAKPAATEPTAAKPFDLSALRKLNLDGNLRVGALKVANVKSSQLRLGVKAHNGVLNLDPLAADLYDGHVAGKLGVIVTAARPVFSANLNLNGVSIAPLLKDAANFDMLEGKGNVQLSLNAQGDTVPALKQGLNGSVSLNLADGAVKGINLAKTLRSVGKLGGSQTQGADNNEKTDFSELKASFKIKNGVAHNDDLSLKSPLLRVSGSGDVDIGHDSVNYLTKATLAMTLEGQGGKDSVSGLTVPVRVNGPYSDLKYTLDFGSMIGDAAKQKLESKKEEVKNKLMDQLKGGGLKGLFK